MEPTLESADAPQDSAANQFGLQDLAQLPLLEQVHRLFHAIQMQYPYKEVGHKLLCLFVWRCH